MGKLLADKVYEVANVRGPGHHADAALDCLVAMGDPRVPDLLTADLLHRPKTLASSALASDICSGEYGTGLIGFDQGLLDEIRRVLRTSSVAPPGPHILQQRVLPEGTMTQKTLTDILTLLASWGTRASPAVPEIMNMLPHAAFGAKVLVAIGDPGPAAVAGIRAPAESDTGHLSTRLTAAGALHDLSAETGPLLVAIRDYLDRESEDEIGVHLKMTAARAARAAQTIDDPPEWLVPALEATLSANSENKRLEAEIRRALCRFTGCQDWPICCCRRPGLTAPVGGYAALEAASDAGRSAESLIPDLSKMLDNAVFCPHASKAIMSAGLGDVDLATLAGHLVRAVGAALGSNHRHALDLLREIWLRDQTAVSRGMRSQLHDLAERPTRIIRHGRKDEALCKMIRSFLEEIEREDR